MAYCAMNGIEVKIPQRALRPREAPPPPPSVTMASKMVAERMLRPRTPAAKSLVGVDVRACLERVRSLKGRQRECERHLAQLVAALRLIEPKLSSEQRRARQLEIDKLRAMIMQIAAQANQLAMDAIKGGASQADVRAAAGEPMESAPGAAPPAAPVIETSQPRLLPDGSVVPGPDATVTTPEGRPISAQPAPAVVQPAPVVVPPSSTATVVTPAPIVVKPKPTPAAPAPAPIVVQPMPIVVPPSGTATVVTPAPVPVKTAPVPTREIKAPVKEETVTTQITVPVSADKLPAETPPTVAPVSEEGEGKEAKGMSPLFLLALAGGAWWLWSRRRKS